ncbi:hypothetical protein ACEPAH_4979 [Sanghuangporus vaninii]
MAPTSTLQDRIKQFEAMNGAAVRPLQSKTALKDRPRPSYPPVPRGQIHSKATGSAVSPSLDLLSDPISPTAASYTVIKPMVPYVPRKPRIKSPSPSPPNLGCNTSLIDLMDSKLDERQDWLKISRPPLAPPLPPRMASQNSGASGSSSTRSLSSQSSVPTIPSRSSSNSLTVEHTYPPLGSATSNANVRQRQGHVSASSTSSFHSVSLSSDGDPAADTKSTDTGSSVSKFIATYPVDKANSSASETDKDRESVDDTFSFETVSSTDMGSPTLSLTRDWEKDFSIHKFKPEPPKLPSRRTPITSPSPSSTSPPFDSPTLPTSQKASPVLNAVRRVPPPPPPSRFNKPPPQATSSRASVMSATTTASDRSSIFSAGTATTAHTSIASCTQLLRPTPVPIVARKRYEAVFFANVNAQCRLRLKRLSPSTSMSPPSSSPTSPTTPRKGWRGVSVDLVTNPEENPVFSGPEDERDSNRLEGPIIRVIWSRSKLSPEKLRDIWNDCALPNQNFLDKDAFAKGMWRIDEELRRVQSMRSSTKTITSYSSMVAKRTTTGPLLH